MEFDKSRYSAHLDNGYKLCLSDVVPDNKEAVFSELDVDRKMCHKRDLEEVPRNMVH